MFSLQLRETRFAGFIQRPYLTTEFSDDEFQSIMAEFSQYNTLKEAIRSKMAQNSSPDIEKIKKNVRNEIEAEFQKKINTLVVGSN